MIAFVVLHYQALAETKNCIDNIKARVVTDKKIIIIDNCSPNGSGSSLVSNYKEDSEVEVILLEDNLGFAKGNNIGYREAKKHSPDYIIVMNNDVFINVDNIESEISRIYDETLFDILGPDIMSLRDNIHQNPQRLYNYSREELDKEYRFLCLKNRLKLLLRIKYLFRLSGRRKLNKQYIDHRMMNVVLHGACYIYSKAFISSHDECLYDQTFMYYESYILFALAQREGLKIVYDPSIVFLHHEDVATDMSVGRGYQKAVFSNKCLLDSCKVFINALDDESVRLK